MLTNRLKVLRAEHDMTQQELAEKVGVIRQTIISIEQGRYQPSVELAIKLARVFSTTVEKVFIYS